MLARGVIGWDLGAQPEGTRTRQSGRDCGTENKEQDLGWLPGLGLPA